MRTQENHKNLGAVERERERERGTLYSTSNLSTRAHKHFYRNDIHYLVKDKESIENSILTNNLHIIKQKEEKNSSNCRGEHCSSVSEGILKKRKETTTNNKDLIKNTKSQKQKPKTEIKEVGITLIALVITIIIILILAGVSLNAIFSEKGILKTTNSAVDKYNEAQIRETLETMLLVRAQTEKYSNNKYNQEDFLDDLIKNSIDGADVKGDVVIIGKYAYELDRSVPKIGKYLGAKKDLIFPIVEATVNLSDDKKKGIITITASEEKNGINKIEIWLDGEMIDEFPYNNEKTITKEYPVTQNGKYTVKVYGKLMEKEIAIVQGIVASVRFEPNGDSQWKKQHSTTVTIQATEDKIINAKYCWSDSVIEPEDDVFTEDFKSGDIIEKGEVTGEYFLWTMLETQSGEKIKYRSEAFYFDNKGPTISVMAESSSVGCLNLSAQVADQETGDINFISASVNGVPVDLNSDGDGCFSVRINNIRTEEVSCVFTFMDSLENVTISKGIASCKMIKWEFYDAVMDKKNVTKTKDRTYSSSQDSMSGYNLCRWDTGVVIVSSPTTYKESDNYGNNGHAPVLFKKIDDTTFEVWTGAGTVKELEHNGQKYNYYYHKGWNVEVYSIHTNVTYKQGGTLKNVIYGVDENEYTEGCTDEINWIKKVISSEPLVTQW